jgi:flagella basal body P-ring formation protein FlgA
LRWTETGGRSGVLTVEAVLRVHGTWLEAQRDLRSGAVPESDDFELREGYLEDASEAYAERFEELAGKRLNRPIRAAEPLPKRALSAKPDVERGDIVELRVQIGGVRLRTAARAESSGSAGDVVALRNLESGGRVLARILDRETAEVERR